MARYLKMKAAEAAKAPWWDVKADVAPENRPSEAQIGQKQGVLVGFTLIFLSVRTERIDGAP